MIHYNIAVFPVILLEDLIKLTGSVMQWFKYYIFKKILPKLGGQYVFTTCHKLQKQLTIHTSSYIVLYM